MAKRIERHQGQFQIDNLPKKGRDNIVSMKQKPESFKKKNPKNKENLCKVKYVSQNKN